MPKEQSALRNEKAFSNQVNEEDFELDDSHVSLIESRLKSADEGEEGLDHSEVFSQLRKRLKVEVTLASSV